MESNRGRIAVTSVLVLVAVGALAIRADDKAAKNRKLADDNARALAIAVQAKAITTGKYDGKLADYVLDLGGDIPINPCSGTKKGYSIVVKGKTAHVTASRGSLCGKWTPKVWSLSLEGPH